MNNSNADQLHDSHSADVVSITNQSGGVDLTAQAVSIGGDVVGRDKIVDESIAVGDITQAAVVAIGAGAQVIVTNIERALTEVEIAEQAAAHDRQQLAAAVTSYVARLQRLVEQPASDRGRRNPFKALLAYDLGDAAAFHGRAEALRAAVTCIGRDPLAVLHANSGLGLTSLLKAGLMPRLLANSQLPLYVRPSNMPVTSAIKHSLLPQLEHTRFADTALRDFLQQVTDLCGGQALIVILDQFEEVFTLQTAVQQADFVSELAQCLADELLPVCWVLALRSDWFAALSTFQPQIRQPFANQFQLRALTASEAREVLNRSTHTGSLSFAPSLIERLLADLGETVILPAQLQIVCYSLVELLPPDENQLTLDLYDRSGGVACLLRDYLENTLARNVPSSDQQLAWQILAELSVRTTLDELIARVRPYDIEATDCRRALDLLMANRLVIQSDEYIQLVSPSLLPRLQQWAADRAARELAHAEAVRQLDRIRRSALRGMFGGAVGFSLAFLIIYGPQTVDKSLLGYLTAYRALPGAIAGLLLVLCADIAVASYQGPRRWRRWLVGGLAGAASFAAAMLFHASLRSVNNPLALSEAVIVGAVWGMIAGGGTVWMLGREHPTKRLLLEASVVALLAGIVLWIAESPFANGLLGKSTSPLAIVLAGAVMPWCVLLAALWPRLIRKDAHHE